VFVIRKSACVAAVVAALIASFPGSAAAGHKGSCNKLCGADKSFAIIAD
jgi:hypothetical protein